MLRITANATVRLLLSPTCAACDAVLEYPLDGPVCAACWRAVPKLTPPCCVRCGDALAAWRPADPLCPRCRRGEPIFSLARSAGQYDGSLRRIVHAFKYERRRALARPLAELMRAAGAEVLDGADALVPVPLHPWRALSRGFNQADDLARQLGLPVWRVLRRRRHGPPQAGLPASRRHANVRHAFGLNLVNQLNPLNPLNPSNPSNLQNRVVVLIDDVMTTGATLDACGRVLIDAGVRSVRALTAARAVAALPPGPPTSRRPSTARRR